MPAEPPRLTLRRAALRLLLGGALLSVAAEAARVAFGPNFHEVVPGRVYRCSQLSPAELEARIRRFGIRTIINLRGCCEPADWYLDEARVAARHDVSFEDVGCSAGRLPATYTVRELVAVFDRTELPALIHCHKGVDRTGLASGMALILLEDAPLSAARAMLGPRYGHLPLGRTGNMDRFFELYEEWLAARGLEHSRAAFRRWALDEYCPGECRAELTPLSPLAPGGQRTEDRGQKTEAVLRIPADRPSGVRVRAHNTSVKPWRLRPGNSAGIHMIYQVLDLDDRLLVEGRAGLFHATVAPGESIDLTCLLPALAAGRYRFRADMIDEQHASFFQAGSEPLVLDLSVR
jgi:hypothetical protein